VTELACRRLSERSSSGVVAAAEAGIAGHATARLHGRDDGMAKLDLLYSMEADHISGESNHV